MSACADSPSGCAGSPLTSRRRRRRPAVPRRAAFMVCAALLAGCAAGPDYVRPETPATAGFARAEAGVFTAAAAEAEFWRRFDDPLLVMLVTETFAFNHDLRAAAARYERARSLYRQTRFDRWPTVTAGGTAADVRSSADEMPGATRAQRDAESYELRVE